MTDPVREAFPLWWAGMYGEAPSEFTREMLRAYSAMESGDASGYARGRAEALEEAAAAVENIYRPSPSKRQCAAVIRALSSPPAATEAK